jgi:hypothetical protein
MSNVPNWYGLLLLSLGAWRVFRLISEDTIFDQPRSWLLRLPVDWEEGDKIPSGFRVRTADFITCKYCLGFWLSLGFWGAWLVFPTETIYVSVPLAISTIVVAVATLLDENT